MSYSFNIRVASAVLAATAIASKFDEVVASQPVHEKDREVAIATAGAIVGLIGEPAEGQEISISVSGWLQWQHIEGQAAPESFTGCSLTVSASIVAKTE